MILRRMESNSSEQLVTSRLLGTGHGECLAIPLGHLVLLGKLGPGLEDLRRQW